MESPTELLVGRDETVDQRLRQRMRHMPTNEGTNPQATRFYIPHSHHTGYSAIPDRSNGSHHGTTQ